MLGTALGTGIGGMMITQMAAVYGAITPGIQAQQLLTAGVIILAVVVARDSSSRLWEQQRSAEGGASPPEEAFFCWAGWQIHPAQQKPYIIKRA